MHHRENSISQVQDAPPAQGIGPEAFAAGGSGGPKSQNEGGKAEVGRTHARAAEQRVS